MINVFSSFFLLVTVVFCIFFGWLKQFLIVKTKVFVFLIFFLNRYDGDGGWGGKGGRAN